MEKSETWWGNRRGLVIVGELEGSFYATQDLYPSNRNDTCAGLWHSDLKNLTSIHHTGTSGTRGFKYELLSNRCVSGVAENKVET